MGSSRGTTETQQTTTPQPTAQESELTGLELERRREIQPQALELDKRLLELITPLARGEQLPGIFASLGTGIDEETQSEIVRRSLADITPQFERLGILRSGPAAEISANLAKDIRVRGALEQVRQRESLLNVLQGFPIAAQAPALQESQTLAQQLAGLRSVTTTGTSATRTPFLQTQFAGGLGQGLGQGFFTLPRFRSVPS